MKLTRKQLRKLIEARIKPSFPPEVGDSLAQKLQGLADSRSEDAAGRQSADRYLDTLIGSYPSQQGLEDYSVREFEYDYPLLQDPKFSESISDLFEIFMYENKVFANDIEDGMSLEEYKDMARDFFMGELPRMATRPGYFTDKVIPPSISHTLSGGKIPYQIEGIVKKIVDPMSERIWNSWNDGSFFG